MAFESFAEFITMNGHGAYVWTCYGVWFICFVSLYWLPKRAQKRIIAAQRQRLIRQSHTSE